MMFGCCIIAFFEVELLERVLFLPLCMINRQQLWMTLLGVDYRHARRDTRPHSSQGQHHVEWEIGFHFCSQITCIFVKSTTFATLKLCRMVITSCFSLVSSPWRVFLHGIGSTLEVTWSAYPFFFNISSHEGVRLRVPCLWA